MKEGQLYEIVKPDMTDHEDAPVVVDGTPDWIKTPEHMAHHLDDGKRTDQTDKHT